MPCPLPGRAFPNFDISKSNTEYKRERIDKNMNLTNEQINDLARPLIQILTDFYDNPENEKAFQEWLKRRQENQSPDDNH